jgi:integrase
MLVELYEKGDSKYLWYDFAVAGKRYRGSTKETNPKRAGAIAALKLARILEGNAPLPKKAPVLVVFAERFLKWVENAKLEPKSKRYYNDGWRLLEQTKIVGMRLDTITNDDVELLSFPGSASNTNCALRTLRRMLHRAEEWKLIPRAPRLRLVKEYGRSLRLDDVTEKKLVEGAAACGWRKRGSFELFRDVVILMRDTGMRNERELYRIRVEHLDWNSRTIFVPDSKTEEGRRTVPMTNRVYEILRARCGTRMEGWIFPSKTATAGHRTTMAARFRAAREKAGLPNNLVLYCGRHDYGTRVMKKTGNLKAVMKVMGHRDVKTAMKYQHPEVDIVRAALDEEERSGQASA